jgi:hypothetical protein
MGSLRCGIAIRLMSALGHFRPIGTTSGMSALPPIADIEVDEIDVR